MRTKIVAGNWKMNLTLKEAKSLAQALSNYAKENIFTCEVIISPSFVNLQAVRKKIKNTPIKIAAQNMHQEDKGAYTGEVSAEMLKALQVEQVILGHSERRQYFGETDEILAKKIRKALDHQLTVIYCNGETLAQRKDGSYLDVITQQTQTALFGLTAAEIKTIVIAYEPVWAIGTGETATAEQAQEIHAHLRNLIAQKYDDETAQAVRILYGGSVKPDNAKEIFSKPDVDGGLIGGAALKFEDFKALIEAAN